MLGMALNELNRFADCVRRILSGTIFLIVERVSFAGREAAPVSSEGLAA